MTVFYWNFWQAEPAYILVNCHVPEMAIKRQPDLSGLDLTKMAWAELTLVEKGQN